MECNMFTQARCESVGVAAYVIGRWSWGIAHRAGLPIGGALLSPCSHRSCGQSACAIWRNSWNRQTSRTTFPALCICPQPQKMSNTLNKMLPFTHLAVGIHVKTNGIRFWSWSIFMFCTLYKKIIKVSTWGQEKSVVIGQYDVIKTQIWRW